MSIDPISLDHATDDTIKMPPLHIYEDSAGRPRLFKRGPVRHENISARTTHTVVNSDSVRRTTMEQTSWEEASWYTESWTAFIDAEGESLSPIFDEVKRLHEEKNQEPRMTAARLRRMKVEELRSWIVANAPAEAKLVSDEFPLDRMRKPDLVKTALNILAGTV